MDNNPGAQASCVPCHMQAKRLRSDVQLGVESLTVILASVHNFSKGPENLNSWYYNSRVENTSWARRK